MLLACLARPASLSACGTSCLLQEGARYCKLPKKPAPSFVTTSSAGPFVTGSCDSIQLAMASSDNRGFHVDHLLNPQGLPALPWETGTMRMIFEEDFLPECSLSAPIPDVRSRLQGPVLADAESHPEPVPEEGPMFVKAIKCIADKEFSERRSAVLEKALQKWRILLVRFEAECPGGVFEGHADSLGPMMGNKSPLTILKRANSLLSLLRWADSLGSCTVFSEATVWRFLQHLQSNEGTSQGSDLLSALRFAEFVLEFGTIAKCISRRCVGLAAQMSSSKPFLKQADPLPVSDVKVLHDLLCCSQAHSFDRALAGFCLLCIYGPARVSDFAKVHNVVWDVDEDGSGYIVFRTGVHKTAQTAKRKRVLLPIIVPLRGVHGNAFGNELRQAFEDISAPLEEVRDSPVLRAPTSGDADCLGKRCIESDEVTCFLRLALEGVASPPNGRNLSSHALKHTALSWSSKAGFSREDQASLGHHADAVRGTDAVYSLEPASGPVQRLEAIIAQIASGNSRLTLRGPSFGTFRPSHAGRLL